jgi:hypothetical protein
VRVQVPPWAPTILMTLQTNLEVQNTDLDTEQQAVLPQEVDYINLGKLWQVEKDIVEQVTNFRYKISITEEDNQ